MVLERRRQVTYEMRYWVIKGNPRQNDRNTMFVPSRVMSGILAAASKAEGRRPTKLEVLTIVYSNCHHMLHRSNLI